jgi:hypothetical protein
MLDDELNEFTLRIEQKLKDQEERILKEVAAVSQTAKKK